MSKTHSKNIRTALGTLFIFVAALALTAGAKAATITAGPISVFAEIPSGLALEISIVDQLTAAQVPSMDFGALSRFNDEYRATRFFNVICKINTAGDAYELSQLSTPLTRIGGTETIPNGAFFVKPLYDEADNGGSSLPAGSSLGRAGTAVSTQTVFTDPTGSGRIVRLQYTLTGDPITGATQVIPVGQKSGSYQATIQFTLTTT